ncbi:MAG: hypothetical protein ACOY32_06250 [Thermodesulfobacteriota bacterium]
MKFLFLFFHDAGCDEREHFPAAHLFFLLVCSAVGGDGGGSVVDDLLAKY